MDTDHGVIHALEKARMYFSEGGIFYRDPKVFEVVHPVDWLFRPSEHHNGRPVHKFDPIADALAPLPRWALFTSVVVVPRYATEAHWHIHPTGQIDYLLYADTDAGLDPLELRYGEGVGFAVVISKG